MSWRARAIRLVITPATAPTVLNRLYHASSVHLAGEKWRLSRGMSRSGNEYGPLTDKPDWTFVDGRPPVQGKGHLKREKTQKALGKRILRLLDEMDKAKVTESTCADAKTAEGASSTAKMDGGADSPAKITDSTAER